jgi:hypothetical protein
MIKSSPTVGMQKRRLVVFVSRSSAQSATIDAMVADHQKRDNLAKMEKDMLENLQILSRELSKLRAEREMTLAEVEELDATRKSVNICLYISGH